ncbi:C6 zinc finger domain protein [Fusarium beomiforme]|uniref:C6 zinc finger domain protein n=1 Tax=Fusarium beomiforme TaxID=44412 RepID=A0A9P5ACX3_9HYPO|nr:C6 zinc finger domain protein [Fusarium beomiforme]
MLKQDILIMVNLILLAEGKAEGYRRNYPKHQYLKADVPTDEVRNRVSMVGVPGRSKACLNCRERKLKVSETTDFRLNATDGMLYKCGLEKPYCARCTRNGRVCGGYERPRIFVHRFQKSGTPPQTTSPLRAVVSGTPHRWRFYVPPPEDKPAPMPNSPDLKIHEQRQLIARFINDFCPELDRTLNECERLHHYWVYFLPHIYGTVDLLDRSILTLSAAFLGRMAGDVRLQKRSMVMYGHTISDLCKAMSGANFYPNDTVLTAIMCLGMSENPAAIDHGWVSHNKGGAELLKTRGGSILESQLGKGLFLRFRVTALWTQLVFEASILLSQTNIQVGKRKSFPFVDPSLRSISRIASQNSHYDMLMDRMVDIPGLLHDINVLSALRGNALQPRGIAQDIFVRAVTIAENLRNWLDGFSSKYPVPYTWATPDSETVSPCLANSDAFPLHFHFPNLLAAQSLIHYWAAMVILMRCIMVCQRSSSAGVTHSAQTFVYDYQKLVNSPHLTGDIVLSEPSAIAAHFADNICYSAAYSSDYDKGMAGPIMLLFPLWIAKDIYTNDDSGHSRQKELYCVELLRALAGRGMQLSGVLINLSTKDAVQTC